MATFRAVLLPAALLALVLLPSWSAAEPPASRPIHIQADQLTYHKATQTYEGKGSVLVVQGPLRLEADEAVLDAGTGQVKAVGRVHLNDGFRDIHGDRMDFNVNTTKGVIFHGRLFVLEGNFTLDARVMERLSDEQYRIEDASYTTCSALDGETVPWRFTSEKAELDVEGFLHSRHTKFCILDVPVFYLPATLFPAKRDRATGLLFPHFGTSSQQGFKIRQAFFWDISPSQDATIALDYRGKQGTGGDFEYRYKPSRKSDTYIWTRYFQDNQLKSTRVDLAAKHTTKFTDDFQGRVNLNLVNQHDTFRALSENVLQRVAVYQESQAFLSQRWDNHVLYGFTRFSQNLTSLTDTTILQTLPQTGYSLAPARLWGGLPVYGGLDATFSSFYRQVGQDGSRGDMFPRLWAPIPLDRYLTITPLVGVHETWYSGTQSSDAVARAAPYFSTTADTRLSRRFTQEGGATFTHKIEPSVTYEYLPHVRQDNPSYDALDRLTPKNLLTYSLTNRLSTLVSDGEKQNYLEAGYVRLTQSQHLASSPTHKPWSDFRGEFIARTLRPLSTELRVDTFYNHALGEISAFNTDLRVNLTSDFFFSIGQRYTRSGTVAVKGDLFNPMTLNDALSQGETTNFYTADIGVKLPYNLYAVMRGYLDQNTGQFPELNYGLYYVGSSRCWGVGVMLNQRPDQTEFAVLFTLGGVGYTDSPFSGLYRGLFQRLGLDIQKLR